MTQTRGAETSDDRVDQFLIYAAYGEVMHQFQHLELTLWQFKAHNLKGGITINQAMPKVEKWDGTTLGGIIRGLKSQAHWPNGILDKLDGALGTRNYLAHHFLREYFIIAPSEESKEKATQELANVSVHLTDLIEELENHLSSLGVPSVDDLDEATQAEIDALRPKEWLDRWAGS